jgi:hypothetical protein
MSLAAPHPLWATARSPFEVPKAVISTRILSGTLLHNHILWHCPALSETRIKTVSHWSNYLVLCQWLFPIVSHHTFGGDKLFLRFLLDPSVLPMVIASSKFYPHLLQSCFYLSRTWNFSILLARQKLRKS